jgi:hypothetical protein
MLGGLKTNRQSEKQRGDERTMKPTTPERDAFLDKIAEILCRRGLRVPALIALEAGSPLTFIAGQLLWLSQPVLSLFVHWSMVSQVADLLEEPESVAALIARLQPGEA